MAEIIRVGMADLKVANHPAILTTLGLGSCVGITLYDKKKKIIGMVHIMLPNSRIATASSNKAKFADTGIMELLEQMLALGANKMNLVAKMAGGAQMFAFEGTNESMKIGQRNSEAAKMILQNLGIPWVGEDTGGSHGRTIELHSEDGRLMVKTIGYGIKYI